MAFQLFREWFKRPAPAAVPPSARIDSILQRIEQLPCLPDTAIQALALSRNEETSLRDFVRFTRRDVSLTAAMLKLANSAIYAARKPAERIEEAVLRLGLRGCGRAINAFAMADSFRPASDQVRTVCRLLWSHSLLTASLCTHMNDALKLGFNGEEFAAGLLHDVGRIVIAIADCDAFLAVDGVSSKSEEQAIAVEREALGTDHCQVGAAFARRSRLPELLIDCIAFHHSHSESAPGGELRRLLTFADETANHIVRERTLKNFIFWRSSSYLSLTQDWSPERRHGFSSSFPMIVKLAIQESRSLLKLQQEGSTSIA